MIAGTGLACTLWAVAGRIQLMLVGAEAALVWHVALVIAGGARAAGTGYGGAAGSCALSAFGCATAGFFLLITLAALVVSL